MVDPFSLVSCRLVQSAYSRGVALILARAYANACVRVFFRLVAFT